jgi:hypothetical protein
MRSVSTPGESSRVQRAFVEESYSWNTHALITRAALQNVDIQALQDAVAVVSLSDFVRAAPGDILDVAHWYWDWLESQGGAPVPRERISPPASEADFVRLIQLNPTVGFPHVRLLQPHEVSLDARHDPSRNGPPGSLYVDTASGSQLSVRDVLQTFSDEPDWGMDQDLFVLDGQRYGRAPFGVRTGSSSQGPFHMGFFHENRFLYFVLPALRRSFVEVRCRLFFALAGIAFRQGVDYWGWRFAAWAMHYLQDLTQPYHARAFPLSLRSVARHLFNADIYGGVRGFINDVLKSRHLIFEAFVHFLLNESVKRGTFSELQEALAGSDTDVDSRHGRDTGGRSTSKIPPNPPLLRREHELPLIVRRGSASDPLSLRGGSASDLASSQGEPTLQEQHESSFLAHEAIASYPPFLKGGRGDFPCGRTKLHVPWAEGSLYEALHGRSLAQALRLCSRRAAHLAPRVDRTLAELFGDPSISEAELFLSAEDGARIGSKFHGVIERHPDTFRRFVSLVCQCLDVAGAVTRYAVIAERMENCANERCI